MGNKGLKRKVAVTKADVFSSKIIEQSVTRKPSPQVPALKPRTNGKKSAHSKSLIPMDDEFQDF
jgi:hypothetical protein